MKKNILASIFTLSLLLQPFAAQAFTFDPEYIISDSEFTDYRSMTKEQIQRFLDRGSLANYSTENWQGEQKSALDIIWEAAHDHGVSPKVLLVLLQKEQSLITDDDPSERQLSWATGYAVCDGCELSNPKVQRFKGFGKQVNSAAAQFTAGYFEDIALKGTTQGKYGPGVEVEINGELITPQNAATASLYAYTPHFHGNRLFAEIYDDWFGVEYPSGSLLQDAETEEIYLIEFGMKRRITSRTALVSRYNESMVVTVPSHVLDAYSEGSRIDFPNYTLLIDEDGKIYLLVDDSLRHIENMAAFRKIGFSVDEAIPVTYKDIVHYDTGEPITEKTVNATGRLVQIGTEGPYFYLENGYRHFVPDSGVASLAFRGMQAELATGADIEQLYEGRPVLIPDGNLVKSASNPTVYLVSEERLREITSEEVFRSYGWDFASVTTVSDAAIAFHRMGDPISTEL